MTIPPRTVPNPLPPTQFIFLFLDGVGLGTANSHNPLAKPDNMPYLQEYLGTPLVADASIQRPNLLLKPLDACLGIPGLPQSATGQTTLYTGQNAAAFLGRHLTAFANGSLRTLIEASGMFKQVLALGGTATLANLYSPAYFEGIAQRRIRYSVGTLLNLTAGLPFRMPTDYAQGDAIYWDITGDRVSDRDITAPPISAAEAGRRLAKLGGQNHLTLFECYLPDYAGHKQDRDSACQVLKRIDAFLESLVQHLSPQTTLVVSSDHGNVEDLSTKRHTFNPVPLLVIGPQAQAFSTVEAITGITPKIVSLLRQSMDFSPVGSQT